jgi:hypothetical protein
VETGVQVQVEPQTLARPSRSGAPQIPHLHLCEWLFLAWTQGDGIIGPRFRVQGSRFCLLQDSENKQGILGEEDSQEQGTRHGRTKEVGSNGLALHDYMGM